MGTTPAAVPIVMGDQTALVDAESVDLISGYRWRPVVQRCGIVYVIAGRNTVMHRVIMGASRGELVDHVNGNGLDNRRSNLRLCSNAQNQQNRHARQGQCPFKGVTWHKKVGKWQAQIKVDGRSIYLGVFVDPADAARAYDAAALEHFGEFANGNFFGRQAA